MEDNIRRVIADIRPQMLEKVIENWTSRLDYIRASRGCHMPEIIFKIIAVGCIQQEKNMVMSETHSEKRKFGKAGESSANKKARREVSKIKVWKIYRDCIPDGVFPIGDEFPIEQAPTMCDSISVHIRRFKKYGKTYYPTPD
ncbi:hypothetical protein TNCV_1263451 [Trichonephila clavipes]|nr:hypothetical protein TNCV_1263451 [Trichonephila clavipes]